MPTVELVHWNPSRPVFSGRVGRRLPLRRPVNNFGDLLGPLIVTELLRRNGIVNLGPRAERRLVTVGSIMGIAQDNDVVWGTGVNGKSLHKPLPASVLDIRAVRGPLTRATMLERGFEVPAVYGDPALLLGVLWDRAHFRGATPAREVSIIPNLNDVDAYRSIPGVISPKLELKQVLAAIASSDFVTGSSLHAIVVAEALGIPARLVTSGIEPSFKYEDYYRGTGRETFEPAGSVNEALRSGGEPLPNWNSGPLIEAFPFDLWR